MTVDEAKKKVDELRERFDAPFNSSDKECITVLYWEVLGKEIKPTSCQQCYHDALIEIYLYLKREKKMKEKSNFRMRAGFIICCPAFENGKIFTNDNLTDAVAKKYLARFPQNVDMFQQLPDGFDVNALKKAADGDNGKKQEKAKDGKKKTTQTKGKTADVESK